MAPLIHDATVVGQIGWKTRNGEDMKTAGNVIFTVVVVSIYVHQGFSKEGPYYSSYVRRDVQSSNTYPAPDSIVIDPLKRNYYGVYSGYGGLVQREQQQNNHPTQNPVVRNINQQSTQVYYESSHNLQIGHEFCSKYQEYQTLLQLKDNHSCLRATDVWPLLEALSQHNQDVGPRCRVHLIDQLSAVFGHIYLNPDYCKCQGHVMLPKFPGINSAAFLTCYNDSVSNYYQKLYNEYYSAEYDARRHCTHHHIWHPLSQIQHSGNHYYCQRNLIINLAHTFNQYNPEFHCNIVSSVQSNTHVQTTPHAKSTTASTTSLTTVTTTIYTTYIYMTPTTPPIAIQTCDKYGTITNIAHGTVFSHPSAGDCVQGDHRASEALLFKLCHTNGAQNWTKGPGVMEDCANIPLYAPVATFFYGSFSSNGGQAGIFLGCLANGFKLAVQECFANSTVVHIENGGHFIRDPSIYSVVLF